jgi:Xaa-Pro aminopeptidase
MVAKLRYTRSRRERHGEAGMSTPHLERAAARRARVLDSLGDDAYLLPGARIAWRSADSDYPFRQDSDFYYLTGFDEPNAVCVLRGGNAPRFVLFVPPRDRDAEIWNGRRAGVTGATGLYGADAAYPIDELDARLPDLLRDAETLHYAFGRDAAMDQRVTGILNEHRRTRPRRGKGIACIRDPALLVHEMRLVKDAYELDCMRRAAQITVAAHTRIIQEARPGWLESELEAILEFEFRQRGARGPAYGSIVGSGINATILHYRDNCDRLVDGQLVLVDAGCEYAFYAADVTRTFPAGTRFTPEQAAVYDLVLAAQQAALDCVRPGASFAAAHERVVDVLSAGLVDLGLCSGPAARVRESGDYRKYYMHRTGHWLGLDVHDVGAYGSDTASRTLAPGMVLTVEPGLYIGADLDDVPAAFRGIGVRIEDDVVVTADGHENLTAGAPKLRADIESHRAQAVAMREAQPWSP